MEKVIWYLLCSMCGGFPGSSDGKEFTRNTGSIPGLGKPRGEGNGSYVVCDLCLLPYIPPPKRFLANTLLSWIWLGSRNLMTTKTTYEDSAVPGLKGSWSSKSLGASHRVAQPQVLKSDLSDSTPMFSPITYSLFSSSTCQTISSPRSREGWNFKYFKTICINALNNKQ